MRGTGQPCGSDPQRAARAARLVAEPLARDRDRTSQRHPTTRGRHAAATHPRSAAGARAERPMRLAIFGLTISSSWGNGHATLWRGLCKALARAGHSLVFFERDAPWYAGARDCEAPDGVELVIYATWSDVAGRAARELAGCDAAIVS